MWRARPRKRCFAVHNVISFPLLLLLLVVLVYHFVSIMQRIVLNMKASRKSNRSEKVLSC